MLNATPFPLPETFWDKVSADPSGCLIWTAATNAGGYGHFGWLGTTQLAHRVAYMAAHGGVPEGLHIDHLCRVRLCVNVAHLEAVTPAENNRRMVDALTDGARSYPTVTHSYVDPVAGPCRSTHVDRPYMRRRCPRCSEPRTG